LGWDESTKRDVGVGFWVLGFGFWNEGSGRQSNVAPVPLRRAMARRAIGVLPNAGCRNSHSNHGRSGHRGAQRHPRHIAGAPAPHGERGGSGYHARPQAPCGRARHGNRALREERGEVNVRHVSPGGGFAAANPYIGWPPGPHRGTGNGFAPANPYISLPLSTTHDPRPTTLSHKPSTHDCFGR
jgi:hypothetical protein